MKTFTYIATLQFDAETLNDADQMLQDYLESADTGLELPDSWEVDNITDFGDDDEDNLEDE